MMCTVQVCPELPDRPPRPGQRGAEAAGGEAVAESVLGLLPSLLPAHQQVRYLHLSRLSTLSTLYITIYPQEAALLQLPARSVPSLCLFPASGPGVGVQALLRRQVWVRERL